MTDKTTPDKEDRPAAQDNDAEPDLAAKATESAAETLSAGAPTRRRKPLITAVTIANFKGIGEPVRIDLRPITLLFGNNSAGKSTILHALCYAHELLDHHNVDAHETELGGDQIDLGGFRQFVHGHRSDRVVRLRFDLNLEDWSVPTPVWDRMSNPQGIDPEVEPVFASEFEEWLNANNPAKIIRSGWVDLAIMRHQFDERPMLAHYEVGINDALVGRIESDDSTGTRLAFNWTHPLFDSLRGDEPAPVHATVEHVREAPDSKANGPRLHHVALLKDPKSPLPNWGELLYLDDDDLGYNDEIDVGCLGSTSYPRFQALVTGALVGIGHTLRDELADIRYLGPARESRARTEAERDLHHRNWSDGAAAWYLLSHYNVDTSSRESDLLKEVNEWIARADRLDTGYKFRRESIIELPAVIQREIIEMLDKLEKGRPPSVAEALVGEIASAPQRTKLQLVTANTGLPVGTSDVGFGISQVLPVVVAALDPDRPGITAIEQPELHVHPRMQVELGDLFAQRLDQGGIFLIETHSEHLLLRIMRRIRQTSDGTLPKDAPKLRPQDVAVFLVEPDAAGALVREMPLNERGDLVEAWPGGFFEEDMREIFDIRKPS